MSFEKSAVAEAKRQLESLDKVSLEQRGSLFTVIARGDEKYLEEMLKIMDQILTEVPVYRMQCDISEEAVKMAYENMRQ